MRKNERKWNKKILKLVLTLPFLDDKISELSQETENDKTRKSLMIKSRTNTSNVEIERNNRNYQLTLKCKSVKINKLTTSKWQVEGSRKEH